MSSRIGQSNRVRPSDWQTEPSRVTTARVQHWANGVMTTAQMPLDLARELVEKGAAFVICDQAIGALGLDGAMDS